MSDPNPAPETPLDAAITDVLKELKTMTAESKEFAAATDQLVKLHRLKQEEEKLELEETVAVNKIELESQQQIHQENLDAKPKPVSRDALAVAGANILGIVLIIWHERDHVMNRTALDFLKRLR